MKNQANGILTRRDAALTVTAFAGAAAMAAIAASGASREDKVDRLRSAEETARLVGYFPNVTLATHEGARVRFYDDLVKDKAVVVSLMYTGCTGVCPLTTANLLRIKEALGERVGRDVFFYALTLDPVIDTPEVLAGYAASVGAGHGFTFLTGAEADIHLVRRRLGLYDPDPAVDADRSRHGAVAVCGNDRLGRWCHVPALLRPERIMRTLRFIVPPETPGDAPRRA